MKGGISYTASLTYLIICTLLGIFAYCFLPDDSHNANTQHTEIALRSPLFTTNFVTLKGSNESKSMKEYFFGKNKTQQHIQYDTIVKTDLGYEITNAIGKTREYSFTQINDEPIKKTYYLGTDRFGRDQLSRIILGIRISLAIGLMAVLLSLIIGIALGAMAGYFGRYLDRFVMYFVNVVWAIPTLLLVFVIVLVLGRGVTSIFVAVGMTMWVDVARLVRGQVMSIKNLTYIQATKSLAYSPIRTIVNHILPNIIGPILVIAASNFAIAILIEAGLSYLGFGVQPPAPSLGNLLNENYGYAISGKFYLAGFPAFMIMSLVLAFNVLGSSLRDRFDEKNNKY